MSETDLLKVTVRMQTSITGIGSVERKIYRMLRRGEGYSREEANLLMVGVCGSCETAAYLSMMQEGVQLRAYLDKMTPEDWDADWDA